ncbi:MAG: phospholipase D-like domain-containing protein [Thermodesulfobacteriota bacterium]|nr:phospholipase D-like domain-containing protein [Thermodesulfobacteriota bacterium]
MNERPDEIRISIILSTLLFCMLMWAEPCTPMAAISDHDSSEYVSVILIEDREYFPAFMKAIHNATDEIVMSFFLFKTKGYTGGYTDRVLAGLVRAVKRGVKVKIILERGAEPRDSMVNASNKETAARLAKKGIDVHFDSPNVTTHTKVVVVDRRYIFLGSHNLTNSALKYNHELSVFIDSPSMATETLRYINSLHK